MNFIIGVVMQPFERCRLKLKNVISDHDDIEAGHRQCDRPELPAMLSGSRTKREHPGHPADGREEVVRRERHRLVDHPKYIFL